jgi:hypothetical protein
VDEIEAVRANRSHPARSGFSRDLRHRSIPE